MLQCFGGSHSGVRIIYQETADEVDHGRERMTRAVIHQLGFKVEGVVDVNLVSLIKGLPTCAEKVHHTSKCPAVDLVISVELVSCFWCTPLFETSASAYLWVLLCPLGRNIKVNHFNFDLNFMLSGLLILRFHVTFFV